MMTRDARDSSYLHTTVLWAAIAFTAFGAWIAALVGLIVKARAGSTIVSVLETGQETVLFRFKNQVYRNHFAALNGEQ